MSEVRQRARRMWANTRAHARKAWLSGLLIFLGVLLLAAGFFANSQPAWKVKPTVRAYNMGIDAYHEPPGLLPASDERPSEYPIERARAYWEQASQDTDEGLRALAFYNLGTFLAREAYASSLAFGLLDSPRVDMNEAIVRLSEAIRLDPDNESAKYNLEVLDRMASVKGEQEGGPGEGYSPGAIEKGY